MNAGSRLVGIASARPDVAAKRRVKNWPGAATCGGPRRDRTYDTLVGDQVNGIEAEAGEGVLGGPAVGRAVPGGELAHGDGAVRQTEGGVGGEVHAAFGLAHSTIAMRKFTTWYRSAYGRPPENAFPGLGFDAINLVAKAILRAKSADPRKVRDALLETRGFAGVSGSLSYAGGSLAPRKAVTVVVVGRRAELAAQIT